MFNSFRLSMTWLHTWFGLVLGFVLMVVFFFGTLSVFDREIDRWAIPETRFEPQPMPSFDVMLRPIFQAITPDADEVAAARGRVAALEPTLPLMNWSAYTTHRDPVLSLYAEFAVKNNPADPNDHVHGHVTIDPRSGKLLPDDQLAIGSAFFYPMHYSLHLHWLSLGYWLVGLAALVMLAALLSGVVMHRKLFREFFTFRPRKNVQRSTLDLHNLTGVLALPFHFMFPLTGLVIFAGIYLPVAESPVLAPAAQAYARAGASAKGLELAPNGVPAKLASVDSMVVEAKRRWATRGMPGEVGYLTITHVGDANGYVSVYRAGSDRVALVGQAVHFAAATGQVLHEEPPLAVFSGISEYLTGLHLQHFEHWLLRWLYVLGGLSGCVCIGTGLVFFVGKRRLKHATLGISGARWVEALAVTAVTGTLLATLSILVANRTLPAGVAEGAEWQERCFWFAWVLAFAHAVWRSPPARLGQLAPAWREQCCAVALLAAGAVLLNWVTTGDHLLRTVARHYWPVAGFDLTLLAIALLALTAALKLRRRERGLPSEQALPAATPAISRAAPKVAHG
jgi:uncharacterized iron-regulated membrane protein